MKKTAISLLLIGLLILVSCSNPPASPEPETPVTEAPSSETDAPEAVDPPQEPAAEEETPAETEAAPITESPKEEPAQPQTDSKTVKFYRDLFDKDEYTLRQSMTLRVADYESTTVSTSARRGDEFVTLSESSDGQDTFTIRILMRDGKTYQIDDSSKTYWVSEDSEETDFEQMTLEVVEKYSEMEFVSGQADVDGERYDTEIYVDQEVVMTYYFQDDQMKFFDNSIGETGTRIYIEEASDTADPALFVIPDDYQESQGVG